MSEDNKRSESPRRMSLGRGLSALFGEEADESVGVGGSGDAARSPRPVPIEFVHPGRFQPRRRFDEESLSGLVESVREKGVLQPLLVRRDPDQENVYEIIAGERRWRAAQIAGLHDVPVLVREMSDSDALEIALIENIQRQDLTALEEAEGYRRLMDEFGHTQEDLGKVVGKSRSHVANMMRLLALPEKLREMVQDGRLTAGHARALLTADDPEGLAEKVIKLGLNVRQTEELARAADKPARAETVEEEADGDADLRALEEEISVGIGLKVQIKPKGKRGMIAIHYRSLDQLDDVLRRLRREE